jgi:ABC-type molybdate transport system substrate-binding protein
MATKIRILSGGAMRPLLRELVPLFERTHDATADIEFQLSAALKRAIQDGAVFDIAILPRPELDDLIALGAITGASAADVARSIVLLAKLGIAAAVAAKVKLTSGPVAELVARGEAELGMQQIIAILPVAGAQLVGPLPAELQNVIIYAAGVSARAPDAQAATAFLAFMRGQQAKQLMRAKGLDPA